MMDDAEFELYSARKNWHLHMNTGRIHRKYGRRLNFRECPKCYRTTHRVLDAMLAAQAKRLKEVRSRD